MLLFMSKVIALVDCDSFFVSCEQKDNPALKNQPVCTLTSVNAKGVVVSRSRQAKALGIQMGAPYFQIKNEYPNVHFLPVRHERYDEISKKVMTRLKNFSPDVEVVSVDEAYIDLTGVKKLYNKSYTEIIKDIRADILKEVDIPVSIGLSTSKTLAKLASDMAKKTGGIFVIRPEKIFELTQNISIKDVSGIGAQTTRVLEYHDIYLIKDFVQKDPLWIRNNISHTAEKLYYELKGQAISLVDSKISPPQSIQDTKSFDEFTSDKDFLIGCLNYHIHKSSQKLRSWDGYAKEISVTLRTKNFQVYEKNLRLPLKTNSESTLLKAAISLVHQMFSPHVLYRSLGVTLKNLSFGKEKQFSLFDQEKFEDDKISHLIDKIEEKFGKNSIRLGS